MKHPDQKPLHKCPGECQHLCQWLSVLWLERCLCLVTFVHSSVSREACSYVMDFIVTDIWLSQLCDTPLLPVHRNRRRHSYRHRHSSEDSWVADAVVSCAPPIPRHLRRNLKQGKYVNVTSLLLPMDPLPLVPAMWQQRGKSSRSMHSITDQQTWLEV